RGVPRTSAGRAARLRRLRQSARRALLAPQVRVHPSRRHWSAAVAGRGYCFPRPGTGMSIFLAFPSEKSAFVKLARSMDFVSVLDDALPPLNEVDCTGKPEKPLSLKLETAPAANGLFATILCNEAEKSFIFS